MKAKIIVAIAVLATVVVTAALSFAQQAVRGIVVDAATRVPIVGADVTYDELGQLAQTTTTNTDGRFEFQSRRAAGVVTVVASGFRTARRRSRVDAQEELQIALVVPRSVLLRDQPERPDEPTNNMSGLDAAASLVTIMHAFRGEYRLSRESASVVNTLATDRSWPDDTTATIVAHDGGSFTSRTVEMDENGVLNLDDLPSGPVDVLLQATGYAPHLYVLEAARNAFETEIETEILPQPRRAGTVSGTVMDRGGMPLAGAIVNIVYPELEDGELLETLVGGRLVTGSSGVFIVSGLVPDTPIELRAVRGNSRSSGVAIDLAPGEIRRNILLRVP